MNDVVTLLRARAASRSMAGRRHDNARIALCIEGGAMRGVVAAGMVCALEELGLSDGFDGVYGSSAGAICGAYFLARQATLGASIYSEDINNARFASRLRLLVGRPIINLDFLVDDVMSNVKALDTDAVLSSATPLAVLATDVATGLPTLLKDFENGGDLRRALRAGATMPVVAGGPSVFRGQRYFDASLSEPIPLNPADDAGFTHIVVLLTRPRGVPREVSWFDRWVVAPNLRQLSAPLAERFLSRSAPYAALQDQIARGRSQSGRAEVLGIRPAVTVRKLERHRATLLSGAESGREAVFAALA